MRALRLLVAALAATTLLAGVTAAVLERGSRGDSPVAAPRPGTDAPLTPEAAVPQSPTECSTNAATTYSSYVSCVQSFFRAVAKTEGPERAVVVVDEWMEIEPQLAGNCHEWKHAVGRAASEMLSPDDALVYDDRDCQYGYRHGVMEGYAENASADELQTMMASFCDSYRDEDDPSDFPECLHGLGHAAAVYHYDDAIAAVLSCDGLKRDDERVVCGGGAIMEFVNSWIAYHEGLGNGEGGGAGHARIEAEVADNLCTRLPTRYGGDCWNRMASLWGPTLGTDYKAMADRCDREAGDFRTVCAAGIGEWVQRSAPAGEYTPEGQAVRARAIADGCNAAAPDLRGGCYAGAITPVRRAEIWAGLRGSELLDLCVIAPPEAVDMCRRAEELANADLLRVD